MKLGEKNTETHSTISMLLFTMHTTGTVFSPIGFTTENGGEVYIHSVWSAYGPW